MATANQADFSATVRLTNFGDPRHLDHFQHVSAMDRHVRSSPEELRLNYYRYGEHNRPDGLAVTTLVPSNIWRPASRRYRADINPRWRGPAITFRVGSENTEDFVIHENVIADASQFVCLAMKKEWIESKSRIIPMPEDEPDVFAIYQSWLYERQIYTVKVLNSGPEDDEYQLLVKAYILGDKMMDNAFKDATIDCIIHKLITSGRFDLQLVDLVYENTPAQSPLRTLLQDVYIYTGNPRWLESIDIDDPLHAEFMKELLQEQMKSRGGGAMAPAPFLGQSTCMYHEHGDRACYKCFGVF